MTEDMRRVFLGGTCGKPSDPDYHRWREDLVVPALVAAGVPQELLFNPVVDVWNEAAQRQEDEVKNDPDTILFFYIGSPRNGESVVSSYSLVELTMALYDHQDRVAAVFDLSNSPAHAAKVMRKVHRDLTRRFPHAPIFDSMEPALAWLATSTHS